MKAQDIKVGEEYRVNLSAFEYACYNVWNWGVGQYARENNNPIRVKVIEKGVERDYTPGERKDGILVEVTDEEVLARLTKYGHIGSLKDIQGPVGARSFVSSIAQEERERQEAKDKAAQREAEWDQRMAAIAEPIDPSNLGRHIWDTGNRAGRAARTALQELRSLAEWANKVAQQIEDGTERDAEKILDGLAPKGAFYPGIFKFDFLESNMRSTRDAMEEYRHYTGQYNTFQGLRGAVDED